MKKKHKLPWYNKATTVRKEYKPQDSSLCNFFHSTFSSQASDYNIFLNCMKSEILMAMKTSVTTYKTTQCHNPEDHNPHFHCNGSLKSQTVKLPASYNCVSVVTRCYSRWWSIQVLVMCQQATDLEHLQKQCQQTQTSNFDTDTNLCLHFHTHLFIFW
jgi:hypothetical protein